MVFKFSIDKEKSLEIIRDLIDKLNKENANKDLICIKQPLVVPHRQSLIINHTLPDDYICCDLRSIPHRHKLAIAEIDINEIDEKLTYEEVINCETNIHDYYDDLMSDEYEDCYNISKDIAIFDCKEDGEGLRIEADYQGTCMECEITDPLFIYNETLKCWIVKDNEFSDKDSSINNEGIIIILDFRDYMI